MRQNKLSEKRKVETTDYNLRSGKLGLIGSLFSRAWKSVNYRLEIDGYDSTTISTYHAATQVVRCGRTPNVCNYILNTPSVDHNHLERIISMLQAQDITFVSLDYPILQGYHTFFYKQRDPDISAVVANSTDENEQLGYNISGIQQMMEILNVAKITTYDDELREKIAEEIDTMYAVMDFVKSCESYLQEVEEVMNKHLERTTKDMRAARKCMNVERYEAYRTKQIASVNSLTHRFKFAVEALMNMSDS